MGLLDGLLAWINSGATDRTRRAGGLLGSPYPPDQQAGWQMVASPEAVMNSQPANMGMSLAPMGLLSHIVYHGSPHVFDKFDISKVGTGEGAQAFGHGMYFAENPGTAKSYADVLGGTSIGGANSRVSPQGSAEKAAANWVDFMRQGGMAGRGTNNMALEAFKAAQRAGEPDAVLNILGSWVRNGDAPRSGGNLYKADIPDELIPRMLDWDKPLSQQPQAVRNAVDKLMQPNMRTRQIGPNLVDVYEQGQGTLGAFPSAKVPDVVASPSDYTPLAGDLLLSNLSKRLGGQSAVSDYLSQFGVPGIRYLDAGSRGAGEGTYNYVLFDPSVAKILSRE